MLCENCNKNVATVHLIEIINQEKKELNLCENCAQETGIPFSKPAVSVSDLFGMVQAGLAKSGKSKGMDLECPKCGMTLREFRTKGRFGCSHDYEVFKNHLDGLLEKIHGATRHVGKSPGSPHQKQAQRMQERKLENLRTQLERAVQKEDYEEAARLRDKIQEMEKGNKVSPERSG